MCWALLLFLPRDVPPALTRKETEPRGPCLSQQSLIYSAGVSGVAESCENENLIQGRRDPEVCFALYSKAKCLSFKPKVLENLICNVQPTAGSKAQGPSSTVTSETAMPPVGSDVIPHLRRARPTARPLANPVICRRCLKWRSKMGHLVTSRILIYFIIQTRPF